MLCEPTPHRLGHIGAGVQPGTSAMIAAGTPRDGPTARVRRRCDFAISSPTPCARVMTSYQEVSNIRLKHPGHSPHTSCFSRSGRGYWTPTRRACQVQQHQATLPGSSGCPSSPDLSPAVAHARPCSTDDLRTRCLHQLAAYRHQAGQPRHTRRARDSCSYWNASKPCFIIACTSLVDRFSWSRNILARFESGRQARSQLLSRWGIWGQW